MAAEPFYSHTCLLALVEFECGVNYVTDSQHVTRQICLFHIITCMCALALWPFELSLNLAYFCKIDSISSIWQNQWHTVIHRTGDCLRHRWYRKLSGLSWRASDLEYGFNSHQSFGQWLKFWANLTNLTNCFSRNLGKTQLSFTLTLK